MKTQISLWMILLFPFMLVWALFSVIFGEYATTILMIIAFIAGLLMC